MEILGPKGRSLWCRRPSWAVCGLAGLAAFGLWIPATAEVASVDLQIKAGLVAALSLTCDKPLTFGVFRMQPGDLGIGETKWRLTANQPGSLPTFNQIAGAFGTATGVLPGPGQGECRIAGASALDGSTVSISFGAADSITLVGATVLGLSAATPPTKGLTVGRFRSSPTEPVIADGITTFAIGADLTVPNDLISVNFGGYIGTITVTATVTDGD